MAFPLPPISERTVLIMFFDQAHEFVIYSMCGFLIGLDVVAVYFLVTGIIRRVKRYIRKKNNEDPLRGLGKDVF